MEKDLLQDDKQISWLEMLKVTTIILLVIIGVFLFEVLVSKYIKIEIIVP